MATGSQLSLRVGVFVAAVGLGLVALISWGALAAIRRLYETKRISDLSITIDSVWILFAFCHAAFVFTAQASDRALLGVLAALAAQKGVSKLARRLVPPSPRGARLLLLRAFSIGHRAERLFDAVQKHWLHAGSIQMIAGYDLAFKTVEPHEFLDCLEGRLARRFIDSEATLAKRAGEVDLLPDRDGRFRVDEFFCEDNTWRWR